MITLYPIRHHGPGSARALLTALAAQKPDLVLIEGPADGTELLHWLGRQEMEPPVAMLVYRPDQPRRAGYFPYADFSPEYRAVRYALDHDVPVRLFDLPQSAMLAVDHGPAMPSTAPFELLARATGHPSYEGWWNGFVEQRRDGRGLFAGLLELMAELRATPPSPTPSTPEISADLTNQLTMQLLADQREAYMRREIRRALQEGFVSIAVVCGAWHAPALTKVSAEDPHAEEDKTLLENLETVDVEMAWVPWTYGRLATHSGYGAGVRSPGWYQHLWRMAEAGHSPRETAALWLSKISALLREEGFDTSPAHVIEALRLTESLAGLRDLPLPGLPELNDATLAVMCGGAPEPMGLIQKKLIVGERMGMVPPDAPLVPLQKDLYARMRTLKLRPDPEESLLKLDLRHDLHLNRSRLLHQLTLLRLPWGKTIKARSAEGTYNEVWRLKWMPEFALRMVEANLWGNTVPDAAAAFAAERAREATTLPALTTLLDEAILADLPAAVERVLHKIQEIGALQRDVLHMMQALPPLARIMRYGDIRQTDQNLVADIVEMLLTRICLGLPASCRQLDDQAAEELLPAIVNVHGVVSFLKSVDHIDQWIATLRRISDTAGVHGLVAGRICRLLLDGDHLNDETAVDKLEQALSPAYAQTFSIPEINQAAAWLDGFLRGANLLLIHDRQLWQVIDRWVMRLSAERFVAVVPLLRRTFNSLSEATRQRLAERVGRPVPREENRVTAAEFDQAAGAAILPAMAELLGLPDGWQKEGSA